MHNSLHSLQYELKTEKERKVVEKKIHSPDEGLHRSQLAHVEEQCVFDSVLQVQKSTQERTRGQEPSLSWAV